MTTDSKGYFDGIRKAANVAERYYKELGINHVNNILHEELKESVGYTTDYKKGIDTFLEMFEKSHPSLFKEVIKAHDYLKETIDNVPKLLKVIEEGIGGSVPRGSKLVFSNYIEKMEEFVNNLDAILNNAWADYNERKSDFVIVSSIPTVECDVNFNDMMSENFAHKVCEEKRKKGKGK